MKQRFYFLITGLLFATIVMAQPPQGGQQGGPGRPINPEEMVKRQTEEMVKELGLDAKQTEKVTAINKKYADKMGEIFQNSQGDREGMREKMQTLSVQKNEELKTILTAEQLTKYQELEKQRMERFRQQHQATGGQSPEKRERPHGTGDE
jgi:Spy/CpxP family protein refolding chaperone